MKFGTMKIILGSSSPRRRELLSLITDEYEIMTADIDERAIENDLNQRGAEASCVSEALALAKAKAVYDLLSGKSRTETVVIGADTSVILDNVIYGKPKDEADASHMLKCLSGRRHAVATGVALVSSAGAKSFTEESFVEFNSYDDFQKRLIDDYVRSGDPMDKAGAYGIQNGGALLVRKIDGDYFNVVGLPVARLARELADDYHVMNQESDSIYRG